MSLSGIMWDVIIAKLWKVYTTFFCCLKFLSFVFFQPTHAFLCLFLLSSNPADDGSELSSGRDTPASSSSRQGLADQTEEKNKKEKKKKEKDKTKKKEKSKDKVKEKEKDKKKAESKKIGFGLLRWVTGFLFVSYFFQPLLDGAMLSWSCFV